VGEDFFKEMARSFVRQNPPSTPLIMEYGRSFPEFIAAFDRAKGLPFLADVARLDRAWLDSFHAADAAPLDPAKLASIGDEALVEARFTAHIAARLITSQYPVADIWAAAKSGEAAAGIDPELQQAVLVARPDIDVAIYPLSAAEGRFFSLLFEGQPLGQAAEQATESDAAFDLAKILGTMISSGAISEISV
jgi:hypothetical protein